MISVRDVDDWYRSLKRTILGPDSKPTLAAMFLNAFDPTIRLIFSELLLSNRLLFGERWWECSREDVQVIWDSQMKRVHDAARRENVLHFDVKEGWGPLCEFLGHEVPRDENGKVLPFPRVNDAASFDSVIGAYLKKLMLRRLAQVGAVLAVSIAAGVGAYRFRTQV